MTLILVLVYFSAGQVNFISKYQGKAVTGLAGSSVNFTWSFSGDVDSVDWGLGRDDGAGIENNGILASLDKSGPVSRKVSSAYNGRVSGTGNLSSGQVVFTLSSIKEMDERFYACLLRPTDAFDSQPVDSVHLVVEGEYTLYIEDSVSTEVNMSTFTIIVMLYKIIIIIVILIIIQVFLFSWPRWLAA